MDSGFDSAGKAQAQREFALIDSSGQRRTVKTDAQGAFQATQLRAGVYRIQIDQTMATVRVWGAQAAPPSAKPAILLVSGGQLQRGQDGTTNRGVLLVAGVVVATAIIVPIAADDDGS